MKEHPTPEEFAELRKKRNASVREMVAKIAEEHGWPADEVRCNHNDDACYCACSSGGPCEHDWTGPAWESEDGLCYSVTCSRCGITAMSHDMRNAP